MYDDAGFGLVLAIEDYPGERALADRGADSESSLARAVEEQQAGGASPAGLGSDKRGKRSATSFRFVK